MSRVIVATSAFNAEKTLPRTIKSILSQTHDDWIWILLDNGSIDATGEIIRDLAKNDSRVVYRSNKTNGIIDPGNSHSEILEGYDGQDFYCQIDADDEYKPEFLKKSIDFAHLHNLDIVVSGSDFIKVDTNQIISQRKLGQNLLLTTPNDLSQYFFLYHQFLRTLWGKLYKLKYFQDFDYGSMLKNISYGGDTYINLWTFSEAKRIGIIGESLHKYYLSNKSMSYKLDPKRIASDHFLHESTRNFLIEKCGEITATNQIFLNMVYYHAIRDTLNVIFKSELLPLEKIKRIKEVFSCKYIKDLFNQSDVNKELRKDCDVILKWILTQTICRSTEGADIASQILVSMYNDQFRWIGLDSLKEIVLKLPEIVEYILKKDYNEILKRLHIWYKRHDSDVPALVKLQIIANQCLKKPDDEIFILLTQIKGNNPKSSKILNIDKMLCTFIEKYTLLSPLNADLACTLASTVCWIIKEDYVRALDIFVSVESIEINDSDTERYLSFAQNLAAASEKADAYIYYKKLWISYLLECNRCEEAGRELYEFEQIMPDDEDFARLRNKLVR